MAYLQSYGQNTCLLYDDVDTMFEEGVPVAGWPQKRELGPLSSGQGMLMQFVDPDRIEQSDRVQAASFAPCHLGGETVGCHMIRVLDSAGSTLVGWGRQQQQQQHNV